MRMNKAWRKTTLSLVIAGGSFLGVDALAATPAPAGLFSELPGKSQAVLPAQAIDGKSKAVKVNFGLLRSGRFFANLPGGVTFEAVRDELHDSGKGRFAWLGHVNGDERSRVVIGVSGDAVAATFSYGDKLFKLEPRADGTHVVSQVDSSDPAEELDPIPAADTATSGGGGGTTSTVAADGGATIDVLVAYTPQVQARYGTAGADALIIQAVAEANQAYAYSGINPRLNLVRSVLTNYTESGDMYTDLNRLTSTGDGFMDELHTQRNTYGADLVSLITVDPSYCGLAWQMTSLSTSFASNAFSVVNHSCATGYYSFAHELGHNQGANHDLVNTSNTALYPYAYGYQDPYSAFRTVMAYNCPSGCTRVQHFSNPSVYFNGMPTGVANYSDNARTINNSAATVSAFRQPTSTTSTTTTATAPAAPEAPSGLVAAAAGYSDIDLAWLDNSSDESGFYVERSIDGVDFYQVASLPSNAKNFRDANLSANTLYSYRVRAWNSVGNSAYSDMASIATALAPASIDHVASADIAVVGAVSGNYTATFKDDGTLEAITEKASGGKPKTRYGHLEHKWRINNVTSGRSVTLSADVQTNTDKDSFTFSYSTDGTTYVDMFRVDAASSGLRSFVLPASISGTVYVRVRDNVRVNGSVTSYSVKVDHLVISTAN